MNLYEIFNDKEKMLLNEAGLNVENKNYNKEEIKRCEMSVEEYILSHSSKNGDINRLNNQYDSILKTLAKDTKIVDI